VHNASRADTSLVVSLVSNVAFAPLSAVNSLDCLSVVVTQPGRSFGKYRQVTPGFDHERGSLRQYLYGIVWNLVRQRWQVLPDSYALC